MRLFEVIKNMNKYRENIIESRNKQYSSENDLTANFKDTSAIAKKLGIDVEPYQVAMVLALLKMVRNANGKESGQSIVERFDHYIDLRNYLDLSLLCEIDHTSTHIVKEFESVLKGE